MGGPLLDVVVKRLPARPAGKGDHAQSLPFWPVMKPAQSCAPSEGLGLLSIVGLAGIVVVSCVVKSTAELAVRSSASVWLTVALPSVTVSVALRSEEHTSELQSRLHLVCR